MTHTASATCNTESMKYRKGTLRDAFTDGFERGYNCASWQDLPEVGQKLWTEADGRVEVDEDNQWELVESMAFESESTDRSYSPFEHRAAQYNRAKNSEALWEAFDAGISSGVFANVAERRTAYNK